MKLLWTEHAKIKMRQYSLSKSKLMNLLNKPERKEEGIVPGTMALMQTRKLYTNGKSKATAFGGVPPKAGKAPGEIWLMYADTKTPSKDVGQIRKIVSAWRYPGISKPGESIPIPEDIKQELLSNK